MKSGDIFGYAFGAIRLRKLRAGLTTLGVVIGIAAIVALLSFGQGLQVTITDQLQSGFAADTLIVSSSSGGGIFGGIGRGAGGIIGGSGSDFNLFVSDIDLINDIDGVVTSAAILQKVSSVKTADRTVNTYLIGVDFVAYSEIYSSTFVAETGEIPTTPEVNSVVVGKRVSDRWENGTIVCRVGDVVEVVWTNTSVRPSVDQTVEVTVAAVLEEIGGFSPNSPSPSDYSVYMPLEDAQSLFGTDECETIVVKLTSEDDETIKSVSDAIKDLFEGKVFVASSTAVLSIITSTFDTVELFLSGIAAISLLVAGIGIMNIMIVSLMERTREIGILKALGMKNRTVLTIFLSEAVIIGVLGAVFGIGLGWVLSNVVTRIFTGGGFVAATRPAVASTGFAITPVLTPTVLLGAFGFGIAVSVIFAIYPAWRASKLKPVDALHYE
jgi:putative ABC transport system permease protein